MSIDKKTLTLVCMVAVMSVLAAVPFYDISEADATGTTDGIGSSDPVNQADVSTAPAEAGTGPVYLDPANGSDENDGTAADKAVATLEKAKELAGEQPIIVCSTIEVGNNEELTIESVTLQRAEGFDGRLVIVYMYGEVVIRNATLDGKDIDASYSLVHTQGGTITIEEGAVLQNNSYTAVTVVNNGHLYMTGGEIRDNTSEDDGGAVYIRKAYADITGGSIHDNTTEKSGGAIAFNSGRLTVGAVEIYDNVSEGTHAGFSDESTSIIGGGAAIYAESNKQNDATLIVNGTTIRDNEAAGLGGAICIVDCHKNNDIEATISGAVFEDNTASLGAAIYIGTSDSSYGYPSVTLSGASTFGGDIALGYGGGQSGPVLTIGEDYSGAPSQLITFGDTVPTGAFAVYESGEPDTSDFIVNGYDVTASGDGLVLTQLGELSQVYLDPENGDDTNDGSTPEKAVASLDQALKLAGNKPIIVCNEIEITKAMSPYTLDGATLHRAEGYTGKLIYVMLGAELTVKNSVIDGMNLPADGSLIHTQQGAVNIGEGAVLQNNRYTAVTVVNGGGELNMTGGKIVNNSSDSDGGAIYIRAGSKATLTGGEISGNSTAASGGAVCVLGGTLIVDGATISGNTSTGTAMDTVLGSVSALPGGGAIYAETNSQGAAYVTISSGTIKDNKAAADGGAVLVYNSHRYNTATTLEIGGGSITGNTADGDGDTVWVGYAENAIRMPGFGLSGTPTVDGDVHIHGNDVSGVMIAVSEGFEPTAPIGLTFPVKPEYIIATGDIEVDDFSVEEYALFADSEGLLVGTLGDDGKVVTEQTTVKTDESGNTVTTTITKVDGVQTGISMEVESETGDVNITDALTDLGDVPLDITIGDITVTVDNDTFENSTNVTISMEVGPDGLTDAQEATVEDALKVIDVSAGEIHELNGTATISVDFVLPSGYDANTVSVLYVDESGGTTEMQEAVYADGVVTFTTTHFSVYMIVADPVSDPVGPDTPDIPDTPDTPDTPGSSDDSGTPSVPGGWDDDDTLPPIVIEEETSDGGMTSTEKAIAVIMGALAAVAVVALVFVIRRN